jgi:hypothetical protein
MRGHNEFALADPSFPEKIVMPMLNKMYPDSDLHSRGLIKKESAPSGDQVA